MSNSFKPGYRYLTIFVNGLEPYLKRIQERNIKLWSKKNPITPPEGFKVIILQDPDGAMIELMVLPKK